MNVKYGWRVKNYNTVHRKKNQTIKLWLDETIAKFITTMLYSKLDDDFYTLYYYNIENFRKTSQDVCVYIVYIKEQQRGIHFLI